MKRISLISLFLLIGSFAYAQSVPSRGTYSLNGNISYSSTTMDGNTSGLFSFNPQFGYFLFDNFYAAASLNYSHLSIGSYGSDSFGFGPELRYYFGAGKLMPFAGVGYQYSIQSNSGSSLKTISRSLILSTGLDYFLSKNVALEPSISYSFENRSLPGGIYINSNPTGNTFRIGIGINYFIK